jgi:hypothetical protein
MATSALKGNASIVYDLPISPFGQVTHQLAAQLLQVRVIDRRARYDWWAEDLMTREVVTVGAGVKEIMASVRFENEPDELRELLRLALQYDVELSYTQDSVVYPVHLVSVEGANSADETPLTPDRDRYGFGEWECRVHLRRIDGGSLDGLIGQ